MESKNDDPKDGPDTVIGDCEPVCARCGRDMTAGVEVQRQIEYRDGRTWRRTLHIHATEWTPANEKGVTS